MNINLEYYKIFYYVGRFRGITRAAKELSISQPAVSQAIKLLEQSLNTILFTRTSKGTQLTTEGEILYSYIKNGYETMELGEKKLLEILNLEAGEIKIGASDMTLQFYLLPYLENFHEKYPKIKVGVTNGPTPETLSLIKDGSIDFGIVSSPILMRPEYEIINVKEIKDTFVAGNKFKELKDRVLELGELEKLPIICLEGNTSSRKYIDRYLGDNKVVLSAEFELATSDMIVQFVKRNLGIGVVMKEFVMKDLEEENLFELKFNNKIPSRNICIVINKKYPLSTAASNLLRMMTEPAELQMDKGGKP
jgi:DNA-binding transcriptional LysR family regulator